MNTNTVWNDALVNASPDEVTRLAQLAPKTLTNASAPDQDGTARDAGLLLTKKQVIDLRKYEAAALALPFTLNDVRDYLNFGDNAGGGAGLKPEDFQKTFSATRRHALRWSPLRESIMLTGSQLKLFASSISTYGKAIEEVYADVRASGLLEEKNVRTLQELKKLELELGDKFPGIDLEPDTVSDLGFYLDQIFEKINDNLTLVGTIKAALSAFGYDLREYILPEIKLRVSLISSSSLPTEVATLKKQIDERALRIDEKSKEYKALVEKSLSAAGTMNLGGLAMAIYMGVEAEGARADRDKLYAEQDQAIETLSRKNQTLGSLSRVKHDLQGLELVAVDADIATQNLMHVWNVMHLYVKTSYDAVEKIDDALSLRRFMTAFREVVSPWKQIETDADALIGVFRDADAEYERLYGIKINPRAMLYQMIPTDYPSVDLQVMARSNALMRDGIVRCRALFIIWNYLPHLHDRFNEVVLEVSKSSGALSEIALGTKMAIGNQIKLLQTLEHELAQTTDAQELKEIEADLAVELAKAGTLITQPIRLLNDRLSQINEVFNQRLTRGFIEDLEKDQLLTKSNVDQLIAEQTLRQTERKVLTDAIDALSKGGIEAIGNDVALTLEQIAALGMAPPQVQVVMFAIEQMKKTIGQIGGSIRLLDMLNERDRLVKKIEALSRDITVKEGEIASFKGKVEFLQAIHLVDDQRRRYVDEYKKAVAAFRTFAAQIDMDRNSEEGARRSAFITFGQQFSAFLSPLSLPLATR